MRGSLKFQLFVVARRIFEAEVLNAVTHDGYWKSPDRELLLHRPSYPGCEWRTTRFEGREPVGHTEYQTLEEAIRDIMIPSEARPRLMELASQRLTETRVSVNPGYEGPS